MHKPLANLCLFLATVLLSARAQALTIYTAEIQGLFTKQKDGVYDKIFAEVQKRTGLEFTTMLVPPSRGRMEFLKQRQCYAPSNKAEYKDEANILASTPFNRAKILAFTRRGEKKITSLSDFAGIRIGKVRGLRIDMLSDIEKTQIVEVTENVQLLELLKRKRVDVFIDYAPDIFYSLDRIPEAHSIVDFDNRFFLQSADNSVICFVGASSGDFMLKFNETIGKMKSDGSLKEILGEYYLLD